MATGIIERKEHLPDTPTPRFAPISRAFGHHTTLFLTAATDTLGLGMAEGIGHLREKSTTDWERDIVAIACMANGGLFGDVDGRTNGHGRDTT